MLHRATNKWKFLLRYISQVSKYSEAEDHMHTPILIFFFFVKIKIAWPLFAYSKTDNGGGEQTIFFFSKTNGNMLQTQNIL